MINSLPPHLRQPPRVRFDQRRRAVAAVLGVVGLLACQGPFEHTNAYHPETSYEMSLTGGVDTSYFALDTLTFTLSTSLDPLRQDVQWTQEPTRLFNLQDGRFVTTAVGLDPVSVTVRAGFGERTESRTMTLLQLPASLTMECGGVAGCSNFVAGFPRFVGGVLRDINGQIIPVPGATAPANTLVSRDTLIARIEGAGTLYPSASVRGVSAGTTWLVGSILAFTDSIQVTVREP